MKNRRNYGLIMASSWLVLVAMVPGAWGQTATSSGPDMSRYMPTIEVPLIGKATVTFPGQPPIKVRKDDLGDVLGEYVENVSDQLSPDTIQESLTADVTGAVATVTDELSDEVSRLIGEKEEEIMAGIRDTIAQLASSIADLGTTPAGEVERLKKMVAKGYSAQQRITYQTLKVDYAWKKSHTTLSPEFCVYYRELNIKGLFDAVNTHVHQLDQLLASTVFTAQERQGYQSLIRSVGDTKDVATAVNIACNLGSNGRGVTVSWMAQGERMDVLDQSAVAMKKRLEAIGGIRDELRRIYVYRMARQQSDEFKQGSFQKKSGLNHVDTN